LQLTKGVIILVFILKVLKYHCCTKTIAEQLELVVQCVMTCCRSCIQRCCKCLEYVKPKCDTSLCTFTPRPLCCPSGSMDEIYSCLPDYQHILSRTWTGSNWSHQSGRTV